MAVCKYFQAGRCSYGNACKYEHTGHGGFGGQSQSSGPDINFTVSGDVINADLTKERPIWRLSSYAPGRDPPVQLIDGKDISPEELRYRAYEMNTQGIGHLFANEVAQLETAIDAQITNILRDIPGAVRFMTDAIKSKDAYRYKTPTGLDLPAPAATSAFATPASAFGASTQPTPAFSASTQTNSTFGTQASTFGQTQQPTSAFGQPTQLTSAFGSGSSFGSKPTTTPTFGQSGFGKSAFGQPAFGQTSFGTPAAPATTASITTPAFGQTAFNNPTPTSVFSQSTQPQSAFGMGTTQSALGFGKQTFGTPAFGQSGFGQATNAFTTAQQQQSPTNVFGQQQQPSTSAFGQPVGAFANSAQQQPANAFGLSQQQQQQQQLTNAFSQPQQPVDAFSASSAATSAPGIFSQTSNAFTQLQSTGQQQPQQSQQSAFGQPINAFSQSTNAFGSVGSGFGNLLNPQVPTAPMGGANVGIGGAGGVGTTGKWDDPPIQYTPEEMEAFKAPVFVLGQIPLVPPPQELCR